MGTLNQSILGGTTRAAPSCGVLLPCPSTLLQHPDPLLPLGQTQSSGLHGLQIRYAAPNHCRPSGGEGERLLHAEEGNTTPLVGG